MSQTTAASTPAASTVPRARAATEERLRRITDHVLEHGLRDASLRRLAAVAGTSHRVLIYHFGTRDGVLGAVLSALRQRESAELLGPRTFPSSSDGGGHPASSSRREAMERAWRYFTDDARRLEMEIFYYLCGQALQDPAAHVFFTDAMVEHWTGELTRLGIEEGRDPAAAQLEARLLLSSARGLLLDRMLTGEADVVDAAYDRLLDSILGSRPGHDVARHQVVSNAD